MSSTFSGISLATSGLYTSQRALETTGHNVSNVETAGYVRQRVVQTDKTYIKNSGNQIGTGVGIEEITQIRSCFLDSMYRSEQSSLGYWQMRQSTVEDIQTVMGELSDDGGIQNAVDEFFSAWEEVSKDPVGGSARASLLEYADSLADTLNTLDDQLDQIQENLDSQIESMVKDINSIAQQVAQLNRQIARSEVNGDNANDYKDQINSLLDTLSEYVGISVSTDSLGMYNVSIGGTGLVDGTEVNQLTCAANAGNGAFNTVLWESAGRELNAKDGMLLGLIEARGDVNGDKGSTSNGSPIESEDVDADAESFNFTGSSRNLIPDLRQGLNNMMNLLVRKINEIHSTGQGIDRSTGNDFFVKINDKLPMEIGNIQINPALEDTDKIAASSIDNADDGSIAAEISDFKNTEYFINDGLKMNITDFYSMLVDWLGTKGQEAETAASNQSTLVLQVQSSQEALSGVSLDEELSNLVKYQHAYNASARVMNMVDGMIETIIQSLG